MLCTSCGCYIVTFLFSPTFDWCVVRWGSKEQNHKNTCFEEVELCHQILVSAPHLYMSRKNWRFVADEPVEFEK